MIKVELRGPDGGSIKADVVDHDSMVRWISDAVRLIRPTKHPTSYMIVVWSE
jgi:hypothetical protein